MVEAYLKKKCCFNDILNHQPKVVEPEKLQFLTVAKLTPYIITTGINNIISVKN